jgi:hypothetical protein
MLGCDADVPEVCSPAKGADPHPIDLFVAALSLVSMKEVQKTKGHHDVGFCGKTEPAGSAPKEIPAVPPVRIHQEPGSGKTLILSGRWFDQPSTDDPLPVKRGTPAT